jgi:radical SAM-linked protein
MRGGAVFPVRVRFGKHGKVRWTSHRDVARMFERAFRIEALPLAFSEGFSPRPKVSFGLALSTGYESDDEYLDVCFAAPLDLDQLAVRLTDVLPVGMAVTDLVELDERAPALQEAVTAVEYLIEVGREDGAALDETAMRGAVERLLAADELVVARTKKGRVVHEDVRGAIRRLQVLESTDTGTVKCDLEVMVQPRSAKPAEVVAALALVAPELGELAERRVTRTLQWIERDGARLSPLDADTRPRVLWARVS